MKTRVITAIVGIIVLIGVMFTFNTLIFNLVIAAITLIAVHEIYSALGFEKKDWLMYAVLVPYTLLVMTSNYQVMRRLVMPMSFLLVTFYAIYLVVRNGTISYQKASGLLMFSGIVIFCFYSFIRLKELLPVEQYGYDAVFFILLILCFAWGGDTCAYFAGRAFGKHKLCPVVSPKKTVEGAIGGVLGTMVFGVIITLVYSVAANRMEAFTRTNIGVSMYVIIALLGCVAAVLVNLIAGKLPSQYLKYDASDQKLFTTGDQTAEIVKGLDEDITLYLIAQQGSEDATLQELLDRYAGLSSHIKVETKDPVLYPNFVSRYTSENLSENSVLVVGQNRSKAVDYYDIYQYSMDYSTYSSSLSSFDGEGQITSAIAYVTAEDMPVVYTLTGHDEAELSTTVTSSIEKENIELKSLSLLTEEAVPEDAKAVIIYGAIFQRMRKINWRPIWSRADSL